MTIIDLIIVVLLAAAAFAGFRQGFIVEAAGILGAVAALAIARLEYKDVRQVLASFAPQSSWLTVISYLLVFLVVWFAILLVARRLRWLIRLLRLGLPDRIAGAVVGFLQGALVVELLLYLGKRTPNDAIRRSIVHSVLAPTFLNLLPYLHHLFPHVP